MSIDVLNIQPQKVSTDLNSYSMLVYGEPKIGKTTFIENLYGNRVLHIMTEKRYKALAGAMVQYVSNWTEYLTVMKQLKSPKAHEMFDVISIDTVENLYDFLEKYIAARYKERNIGEDKNIWGADWTDLKKSWKDGLMLIERSGYVPVFVSHATQNTVQIPKSAILDSDKNGLTSFKEVQKKDDNTQYIEFAKYVPDLKDKYMAPINKMVDNILFLSTTSDEQGKEHRVINTRSSLQWLAGSTFKNIQSPIPLSAEAYRKAVEDAISHYDDADKTSDRQADFDTKDEKLDFDALNAEAQKIAKAFYTAQKMDVITQIVNDVFGKGEKLTSATPQQVEQLAVAVGKMQDAAKKDGIEY